MTDSQTFLSRAKWRSYDDFGYDCRSILATADGRIWAPTGTGLVCFDGNGLIKYTYADGLPTDALMCIAEDADKRLWIGHWPGGVSTYDGKHFERRTDGHHLSDRCIRCIMVDSRNRVWVGTQQGLTLWEDGRFGETRVVTGQALDDGDGSVMCLYEGHDGVIWIGTAYGLYFLDGDRFREFPLPGDLTDGRITDVVEGTDGSLWIASNKGLARWHSNSFSVYGAQHSPVCISPFGLFVDRRGWLWIGSESNGLCCFDGARFTSFSTRNGLPHESVVALCEDAEHNIWAACQHGGMSRLETAGVVRVVDDPVAQTLSRHGKAGYWWGRDNTLVRFHENRAEDCRTFPNALFAVLQDSRDRLWVGTSTALYRWDNWRQSLTDEPPVEIPLLGNFEVWIWSLYEDPSGTVWIGANAQGLMRYDEDAKKLLPFGKDDGWLCVTCILAGNDGRMWKSSWSGAGLRWTDGKTLHAYTAEDGLPSNYIQHFIAAPEGGFWIATSAGISRFDGHRFINYNEADGLAGQFAQRLCLDSRGHLWIAFLGGGISRFDGHHFQTIARRDGLPSSRVTGILEEPDGSMLISTYCGVCRYVSDYGSPPRIAIRQVEADQFYESGDEIVIPNTAKHVHIRFLGRTLKDHRLRYIYRLNGYEDAWRTTWDTEVLYSDLPTGSYTFEVQAMNRDMVRSESPAEIKFAVVPDPREVHIEELTKHVQRLEGLLPICCVCKRIRNPDDTWEQIESYVAHRSEARFSHSYCPKCYREVEAEVERMTFDSPKTIP